MLDETKSKLLIWAVIVIGILLMIFMLISIFNDIINAEEFETLVNEYPVWVFTAQGDSTFQTVQIIKCRRIFPNGQRELLGYKVVVDSLGIRTHEEEPVWFLNWATWRALNLRDKLDIPPRAGERRLKDGKDQIEQERPRCQSWQGQQ